MAADADEGSSQTSTSSTSSPSPPQAPSSSRGAGARKSVGTFLAGSTAGVVSACLLQPFDVVKTRLQAHAAPGLPGSVDRGVGGTFRLMRAIATKEGIGGLWKGTAPSVIRVALGAGLYFVSLDYALALARTLHAHAQRRTTTQQQTQLQQAQQQQPNNKLPGALTMVAGASARSFAAAALCPVTVVKTRMEYVGLSSPTRAPLNNMSTWQALRSIAANEGVRKGLYAGLGPTLARDAPYSALNLIFYQQLQHYLSTRVTQQQQHLRGLVNFASGAASGALATLLTHPPDVVRTRLQLGQRGGGAHTNMSITWRGIVAKEGVRGLFAGVAPRVMKRALQMALTWAMFEELNRVFSGAERGFLQSRRKAAVVG
eukprot:jgi/Chlat1/3175/Chrsp22S03452